MDPQIFFPQPRSYDCLLDYTSGPRAEFPHQKRLLLEGLDVNLLVTITDHTTGQPAPGRYDVYSLANNSQGEKTIIFPCSEDSDFKEVRNDYSCTVIVGTCASSSSAALACGMPQN